MCFTASGVGGQSSCLQNQCTEPPALASHSLDVKWNGAFFLSVDECSDSVGLPKSFLPKSEFC